MSIRAIFVVMCGFAFLVPATANAAYTEDFNLYNDPANLDGYPEGNRFKDGKFGAFGADVDPLQVAQYAASGWETLYWDGVEHTSAYTTGGSSGRTGYDNTQGLYGSQLTENSHARPIAADLRQAGGTVAVQAMFNLADKHSHLFVGSDCLVAAGQTPVLADNSYAAVQFRGDAGGSIAGISERWTIARGRYGYTRAKPSL